LSLELFSSPSPSVASPITAVPPQVGGPIRQPSCSTHQAHDFGGDRGGERPTEVSCLGVKTGKVLWQQDFDCGFSSSPILVNDRVYIIDLSGAMQIFRMNDEFELLGVSEIGEDAYATPAFVGDRIYIRGLTHLFCIEELK
jgi:outer membrane protein assembly factor BamB